jgi:hypothetical protein
MNINRRLHDRELNVLDAALAAFTRTTGLDAAVLPNTPRRAAHRDVDAAIQVKTDGKKLRFFAEIKTVDRTIALAAAKNQLKPYGDRGILIAPYVTPELANRCRNHLNLYFIDTAGNAYLRGPGLYVFVRGERPRALPETGTRGGGTATGLRIIFALLCRPALLNAPYREIAAAAGVALGAVGWVFHDLQRRGYIAGGLRNRNRRLLEAERLLGDWIANFPTKLRPKLNVRRFEAPNRDWWEKVQLEKHAWWGGEVAAAKLTEYLKPATYTIYVDRQKAPDIVAKLVRQNHLRAAVDGNIEILDAFWNFELQNPEPDLVPPILIYADLMATLDPRNLDVAKRIREQYIDNAIRRF